MTSGTLRPGMSLEAADNQRAAARLYRAEWKLNIVCGLSTIDDFIKQACTEEGKPLLRVTLYQLLLSQQGWGRTKTRAVLRHLSGILALAPTFPVRRLTVAWLLDVRVGGKRFQAWLDALHTSAGPAWHRFPYTPAPYAKAGRSQ